MSRQLEGRGRGGGGGRGSVQGAGNAVENTTERADSSKLGRKVGVGQTTVLSLARQMASSMC